MSPLLLLAMSAVLAHGPRFVHDAWTVEDGLPQNSVVALAESRQGFLWVGTLQGVARFDGARFRTYDSENGLDGNRVTAIHEDRNGRIWIATETGGVQFLRDDRFVRFESETTGLRVSRFHEDAAGGLWVATSLGVLRIRDGESSWLDTGLIQRHEIAVRVVVDQPPGTVWFGASSGLFRLEDDRWTSFGPDDGLAGKDVRSLDLAPDGALWVGTTGGVNRLADSRFESFPGAPGTRAVVDSSGRVWAYGARGLRRLARGRWVEVQTTGAALPIAVDSFLEDQSGSIWIGSRNDGLHRLREPLFDRLTVEDGLPHQVVHSVIEDDRGTMWVGTLGGLARVDRGSDGRAGVSIIEQDEWKQHGILALECDEGSRSLWIGGGGVLTRLREDRFEPMPDLIGTVRALQSLPDGRLWIANGHGISLGRDERFELIVPAEENRALHTVAIHEDRDGVLWYNSGNDALCRHADGQSRCFASDSGVPPHKIRVIVERPHGALWLGTYGGGLCEFRDERARCLDERHGLPDRTVHSVLDDGLGFVWLSSNGGIFRADTEELNAFFAGEATEVRFDAYDRSDGMPATECNGGIDPPAWRAADGRLWFPTMGGLAIVRPAQAFEQDVSAPHIYLDGLSVDAEELPLEAATVLEPGSDRVVFSYGAAHLSAALKVRLRYRLEGHDATWLDSGAERSAIYTNLGPGPYTFRVHGRVGSGPWSEEATLAFELLPRFHQTAWFRLLAVGLVALGLFGIYRYRVRRLLELERLRLRIAGDLHDDLSSNLSGIALLGEMVERDPALPESHRGRVGKMTATARRLVEDMRDIVWFVDPGHDRVDDLVLRMKDTAGMLLPDKDVRFTTGGEPAATRLNMEFRRHVFLIFKEVLHNVARHAGASRIDIEIRIDHGRLLLEVTDDGVGFEPGGAHEAATGHGLKSLQRRAAELGGELSVSSRPGEGTRVRLSAGIG